MNRHLLTLLVLGGLSFTGTAQSRTPHLGYVYPAGGQQGTTVEIIIGGQNLHGVNGGLVTGTGVKVLETKLFQPFKHQNTFRKELQILLRHLSKGTQPSPEQLKMEPTGKAADGKNKNKSEYSPEQLYARLKQLSPQELDILSREVFTNRNPLQLNPSLAQKVMVRLAITADAPTGLRELRLKTPSGLSNPLKFAVGNLQEIQEPPFAVEPKNTVQLISVPAVINGQIMPGEINRFRFLAGAGQRLTFAVQGRTLLPFLGDAVPGWFQPVIAITDNRGRELAFADDYRFNPDPILIFPVPADGEYQLRINDAIYRGRDDFVYRVTVTPQPLPPEPVSAAGREYRLPETTEPAMATDKDNGTRLTFPQMVNGCIDRPGAVDIYTFEGHQGEEIVAEIFARRMNSPLDTTLKLTDPAGRVIQYNDDYPRPNIGIQTHNSDSYIRCRLPTAGIYRLLVSDTQSQGGPAYFYRLRLDRPRPGFELYATPSALNIPAGLNFPLTVTIVRRDGFNGEVKLELLGAPNGTTISGNPIPPDRDRIVMTLAVPQQCSEQTCKITLRGTAMVSGQPIVRSAAATDEQMQAFAYHHLVVAEELLLTVIKRGYPLVKIIPTSKLELVPGGTAELSLTANRQKPGAKLEFELVNPPTGISLSKVESQGEKYRLMISATPEMKPPLRDNLLIKVIVETNVAAGADGKNKPARKYRSEPGILPAIPLIVKRQGE